MHTHVEIVASPARSLRHHAAGGLAVRRTGPFAAHLVGTAATPLGGDEIDIRVVVEPGARLDLGSVAAMIALAAADRPDSVARWRIEVGAGGRLRVAPRPTVVAGGADHRSEISVSLDAGAVLDLHEHVQIGRSPAHREADDGGRFSGALHIDLDGRALLRHRLEIGMPTAGAGGGHRALSTVFCYPDTRDDQVDAKEFAVRCALAGGGSLTSALGDSVAATELLAERVAQLASAAFSESGGVAPADSASLLRSSSDSWPMAVRA